MNLSELVVRSSATDAAVTFAKWARASGITTPDRAVKIAISPRGLRCLVTTKQVSAFRALVIVPGRATLGLHAVLSDPLFPQRFLTRENYNDDIGMSRLRRHHIVLASYMSWAFLTKHPTWSPYMCFLPRSESDFKSYHETFDRIQSNMFFEVIDPIAKLSGIPSERFALCVRWAITMIMSRGLYFTDAPRVGELYKGTVLEGHIPTTVQSNIPIMCPMMDLVNHNFNVPNSGASSPSAETLENFRSGYGLEKDPDSVYFTLSALKDIMTGEEVVSKYTANNPKEFEYMYGFPGMGSLFT